MSIREEIIMLSFLILCASAVSPLAAATKSDDVIITPGLASAANDGDSPPVSAGTIFSDDFSGSHPGSWSIGHDGGGGAYAWAWPYDYAHCYADPNGDLYYYPDELHVYMERRGISLSGYTSATLSFYYVVDTEADYDYFTVNVRDDSGIWHEIFRDSGVTDPLAWSYQSLDLSTFCGQTNLYVQFRFDSDGSVSGDPYGGVFIDDAVLTAATGSEQADLALLNLTATRPADSALRTFTACGFDISNNGPALLSSESVLIEYYLSDDTTFGDADDKKIGDTGFLVSLSSQSTVHVDLSETGLSNMCRFWSGGLVPNGSYYVYALASITDGLPHDPTPGNDYTRTGSTYLYTGEMSLLDAVDASGFSSITTGSSARWFGQTTTYYYDGDAAQSADIDDGGESYMYITVAGPGWIKFYWKVSSEMDYDYLQFYNDTAMLEQISGTVDWGSEKSFWIGSGPHTLEWRYTKDGSVSNGSDCGWVDYVRWEEAGPPQGEIHGSKWNDLDGDGQWVGEPNLPDWKIYLDENGNGQWDDGEPNDWTDPNGSYSFTGLEAGTYIVGEVLQSGWQQTYPAGSAPAAAVAGPATYGDLLTPEELATIEYMIIDSPPNPPLGIARASVDHVPLSAVLLSGVSTSRWSYGCSATSAGMLFGYYDLNGYPNMYAGPTNGGLVPLTDLCQGDDPANPIAGACSICATQQGFDGRATTGHVDDYWVSYGSAGPDPWEGNWAEHSWEGCTADFMGTNQWKWDWSCDTGVSSNVDGATTYFYNNDGTRLYDYIPPTCAGLPQTALCHGMRLFAESRGYTVVENYNQTIDGFLFSDYTAEIDAGYPVLIHVTGHTMIGVGYDAASQTVYLHDTWDNSVHTMTWGGSYSEMQHLAVTVIHLEEEGPSGSHKVVLGPDEVVDNINFGNRSDCTGPQITQQPQDVIICQGQDAVFNIAATGSEPLHYQWKKDGADVGTDSSTLTLYAVQLSDDGSEIWCVVTNECGPPAVSLSAWLTVYPWPSVTVNPDPNALDAGWTLDGPNGYTYSSNGDETLTELEFGSYTITWSAIPRWDTPLPNPDTQSLSMGNAITFIGNYHLIADFNNDYSVDYEDLARLANEWLWTGPSGGISEDILEDGVVDLADFALLAQNWLAGVGP